ncbi:lycopene cyclase family protein [Streptomyces ficellus]|uniref:Lycopene cyclase n=1 Tax=Streptomyces ficellus TaxID=1977088 RepID=A0A6I6FWE7_9ACTN|nr:lycopene cyclase family protein [Streptomyces ficellus]QGV82378.1 lycopene cyclase [Streptomyces ficellus]
MVDTEVAVVGAGAAGLSLAHHLCAAGPGGPRPADITLIDAPAGPLRPPERTWCYWEEPGGDWDDLLVRCWDRLRVRGPDGGTFTGSPGPLRYKMLRSDVFTRAVGERIGAVNRVEAAVRAVLDRPDGADVLGVTADGRHLRVRARWVFDSRPPRRPPPARTLLLQHFQGWFLHSERPVFDPATVELMDFRVPQPHHGLAFGYVLPIGTHRALVEYTEFSAAPLRPSGYDRALRHYLHDVLGVRRYEVTGTERGVIPMGDGRHRRRAGRSVFRIGAAGGATRPSTGYTFAGLQRQTRAVADALRHGRLPLPPAAHPARSLAMDAVVLRALDTGRVDGPAFFTGLFRTVPTERLLRFLDGETHPLEELGIGLRTPVLPMLRTVAELPVLPRRHTPAGRRQRNRP